MATMPFVQVQRYCYATRGSDGLERLSLHKFSWYPWLDGYPTDLKAVCLWKSVNNLDMQEPDLPASLIPSALYDPLRYACFPTNA